MYRDMPADERQYWLNILSVEGEVAAAYRGLDAGDSVFFYDNDDE